MKNERDFGTRWGWDFFAFCFKVQFFKLFFMLNVSKE